MIIIGAFNIYPKAVEVIVYEHPDLKESVVVSIPDPV